MLISGVRHDPVNSPVCPVHNIYFIVSFLFSPLHLKMADRCVLLFIRDSASVKLGRSCSQSWSQYFDDCCLCGFFYYFFHVNICQIIMRHILIPWHAVRLRKHNAVDNRSAFINATGTSFFLKLPYSLFWIMLQYLRIRTRLWSWWSTPVRASCMTTSASVGDSRKERRATSSGRSCLQCTTAIRYCIHLFFFPLSYLRSLCFALWPQAFVQGEAYTAEYINRSAPSACCLWHLCVQERSLTDRMIVNSFASWAWNSGKFKGISCPFSGFAWSKR